jgi:AcrR family transcriptional regulator
LKPLKQDRRSQRTQRLLGEAFVELMHEKSYDAITVQDILDRADVGRSTFYTHYLDKEDLLMSELARVVHLFGEHVAATGEGNPILPSLVLFRHVLDYRQLYLALVWGHGIDVTMKHLQAQLCRYVEHQLSALICPDAALSVPLPLLSNFVVGTFLSLLRWWLDGNPQYTPEQIDAMFWRMVEPGITSVLGKTV